MTYKLVIAERPSVTRSVVGVAGATEKHDGYLEGNGYLVSWCIGHLVSFAGAECYDERFKEWRYEDLPILPEAWQYIVPGDKKQQLDALCSLMQRPDVTGLVCATDAGREGKLIFRLVYQMARCQKPFERLWISSMEDSAIKDDSVHLKPDGDYDPLYQSALCRAKADQLIGINTTRPFSVLYHKSLVMGHAQTPTLRMLVDRDTKITGFEKEKYHIVHITVGGTGTVSNHFSNAAETNTVKAACAKMQAVCVSVAREKRTEQPLELYDLTTLQRETNRLLGYIAKRTLNYAQTLYLKKLLTYPRTDSQYLTDGVLPAMESLVSGLWGLVPFAKDLSLSPQFDRILNSRKMFDHHVIIPTIEFVKQGFGTLAEDEKKLLSLICCKLSCTVAGPHTYEAVTATLTCTGQKFTAKGKTILSPGWKEIEHRFRSSLKTDADEDAEAARELPGLCEDQAFASVATSVTKHFTTPPRPYTGDMLLSAMERAGIEDMPGNAERKGLGTPATHAAILEKLVQMGSIQRKGRRLIPTKGGINLAVVLPEAPTSPQLTAGWENRLIEIAKEQTDPGKFMDGIEAQARELVQTYSYTSEEKQELFQVERVPIRAYPRCGKAVYEDKRNYCCGSRACQFIMQKNDRFSERRKKAFTPKIATTLLRTGKVKVKDLYSVKTGKTYDGIVLLADTGGEYVNYRTEHRS